MARTFIREIPIDRLTDKDYAYYSKPEYEIEWKWSEESIIIWAKASDDETLNKLS